MENQLTQKIPATLPQLLKLDSYKQRFTEVLGKNSAAFTSSLLTIFRESDKLQKCEPKSIITAAVTAAALQLPIAPQLGYAYIVPYGDKATFAIGYKGLIQLAMRSGQFKTINASEVYDGQIKDIDFITGEIVRGDKISDTVVGYVAYIELLNGFKKSLYMTRDEMENYALRYSDSYRADRKKTWSTWAKSFDAMAKKTVLKKLLSTYAPLSLETQNAELATALKADQAVISKDNFTYPDNGGEVVERAEEFKFDTVDVNTGEVIEEEIDPFVTADDVDKE